MNKESLTEEKTSQPKQAKDIKDYLHLYLGCEFMYGDGPKIWSGWSGFEKTDTYYYTDDEQQHIRMGPHIFQVSKIKLLLRPLSDMTVGELNEVMNEKYVESSANDIIVLINTNLFQFFKFLSRHGHVDTIPILLSKGFDLFGLIEAGLAIDKTKL